jgi:crotonobetainyl-CoA:carnitine CoA-transferase CaiB-like acyl-CoA transferase
VYPDGVPGDRPYDRSCWFNSQNHDKSGVVIDNKTPEGRSLLRRLALASDVVLANLTPGALERMGLGYESLAAEAPEVIVVEMPAFGRDGPQAGLKGLGPTMEAMAGLSSLIGYADTGPLGSGSAYLDPVGALNGAAACVTALAHRARSGRGQHVEVAQREAAMHWMGEILLVISSHRRSGARGPRHRPLRRVRSSRHGSCRSSPAGDARPDSSRIGD